MKRSKDKPELYRSQERLRKAVLNASSIMRHPVRHSRAGKPMVNIRNDKAFLIIDKRKSNFTVVLNLKDDWNKDWVYKLVGRKLYGSAN